MELKKGYKQSEVGVIPKDWDVKPFEFIVDRIVGGGTPSRTNASFWNGELPWVTVKDFATFNEFKTQEYITEKGLKNSATNLIPRGTLITSTRMALGKAVIYKVDVTINQDLKALFLKKGIDRDFLFYWFQHNSKKIEDLGSGSTVMGISLGDLKKIQFVSPPTKAEQTAIATALNDMDNLIAGLEKLIEKKKAIKQGAMQELLRPKKGWVVKKLGELSMKITVGFVGTMSFLFLDSGIPVLRGLNIHPGKIDLSILKYISTNTHKEWSKSSLKEGDVLLVRVGYPGTAAVVPKDFPDANAASLVIVRPNEKLLCSEYLAIYLNSNMGIKQIQEKLVGGAQQVFNTSTATLLEIPIPISIEEQKSIADSINTLEKEIGLLQSSQMKYRQIKQGMMQELLTGKTRLV